MPSGWSQSRLVFSRLAACPLSVLSCPGEHGSVAFHSRGGRVWGSQRRRQGAPMSAESGLVVVIREGGNRPPNHEQRNR
ncbi:hypothetical protein CKAH01_06346 [Colletotrichum kahawae]|uniref:Secreted protein n=1 Tax=Colletotrichum kahawae TaxID=34407 RepID=A0AAD9YAV6_COLKA|nr:hypothetical protein CKAH01_06346 [Colletotrichum kahawae]